MGNIENRWASSVSRRHALVGLAGFLACRRLLGAQLDPRPLKDHRRVLGFDEMLSAFDFETVFSRNLPQWVVDYTDHGAESEWTLRRNRLAFDWADIVERAETQVAPEGTATELFGTRMTFPILVAPTAAQGPLHPDGEMGMHVGATGANATMLVSIGATHPIERIAAAAKGPLWYQYTANPRVNPTEVLARAQAAGCRAIAVTVDNRSLYYERDLHSRHLGGNPRTSARPMTGVGNDAWNPYGVSEIMGPGLTWNHLDEVRRGFKGPMLIKGIQTAEDVQLCLEHGVDGIIVSNHGGRALDYGSSTLEVLPEIVDAVNGRIPVLIDSGFRRGSDVFKALALGAKGVLLGRATRWGLGAFGPAGVQRVLEIVQNELVTSMKRAGCPTLAAIGRSAVRTRFA
jgi:isopentenyl diphosphate isomerase/L-lactate dehydrogenase-like FMN-dependent dehydrogenase